MKQVIGLNTLGPAALGSAGQREEDFFYYEEEEDFGYKKEKTGPLDDLNNEMFFHLEEFVSNQEKVRLLKISLFFGFLAVFVGAVGVDSCQAKEMMRSRIRSHQKSGTDWLNPIISKIKRFFKGNKGENSEKGSK